MDKVHVVNILSKYTPFLGNWYDFILKNQDWIVQLIAISITISISFSVVIVFKLTKKIFTIHSKNKKRKAKLLKLKYYSFEIVSLLTLYIQIYILNLFKFQSNILEMTTEIFLGSIISKLIASKIKRVKYSTAMALISSFIILGSSSSPIETFNASVNLIFFSTQLNKIITFFIVFVAVIISFKNIQHIIVSKIDSLNIDTNLKFVLKKIESFLMFFIGFIFILKAADIDLKGVTVFTGAFGIGIGLGMQKAASGFVDGIIILLDGKIKIGDLLIVNSIEGIVDKISTRNVSIRKFDGSCVIVPSETIVSSSVVNRNMHGRIGRTNIQLPITTESNHELAMSIMEKCAKNHQLCIKYESPRYPNAHPPLVLIREAGEKGVLLDLMFWMVEVVMEECHTKSEITCEILKEFKKNNIKIHEIFNHITH